MRQKFRKAVAALSRGQLFRIDQTVAFDFVEPDYDPNAIGACCTDSENDGTFCDCESNVTARDCCLQKGIHSPGLTCSGEPGGTVTCCEPPPPFVGCCIPGQAQCFTVREDQCAQLGGVVQTGGCANSNCGCNGAWCCDDGNSVQTCTEANQYDPPDGGYGICSFQGCDTACENLDCGFIPRTGACCGKCGAGTDNPGNLDGSCSQSTEEECTALGGQFNGVGSECHYYACFSEGECNNPNNSCCHISETGNGSELVCSQTTETECAALNGIFTENSSCDSDPCANLLLRCCCDSAEFEGVECDYFPDGPYVGGCNAILGASPQVVDPNDMPPECQGTVVTPGQSIDCSCDGGITWYVAGGDPSSTPCTQKFQAVLDQCDSFCDTQTNGQGIPIDCALNGSDGGIGTQCNPKFCPDIL